MLQISSRRQRGSRRGSAVQRRWLGFIKGHIRQVRESIADLIHNVDTFRDAPDPVRNRAGRYVYEPDRK